MGNFLYNVHTVLILDFTDLFLVRLTFSSSLSLEIKELLSTSLFAMYIGLGFSSYGPKLFGPLII